MWASKGNLTQLPIQSGKRPNGRIGNMSENESEVADAFTANEPEIKGFVAEIAQAERGIAEHQAGIMALTVTLVIAYYHLGKLLMSLPGATATLKKANDNASPAADAGVNPGSVQCHPLTIKVKLTNLSSGTYQSRPQVNPGEPVPYGLAGYIYGIEAIPQIKEPSRSWNRRFRMCAPSGIV